MDTALIQQAIRLEKQFAANGGKGLDSNPPYLVYRTPDAPIPPSVILSAPHAVKHWRDGAKWFNEVYTGPLALQLAEQSNGAALIFAKSTWGEAPNYGKQSPYRHYLLDLCSHPSKSQLVVVLQGIPANWRYDLYIGTGHGKNLLDRPEYTDMLIARLHRCPYPPITWIIDARGWDGLETPVTIARTISSKAHIPTMQIAINRKFRDPEKDPEKYIKLLTILSETISDWQKYQQGRQEQPVQSVPFPVGEPEKGETKDMQKPPRDAAEIINAILAGDHQVYPITEEEEEKMRQLWEEETPRILEAMYREPNPETEVRCQDCGYINPKDNDYCYECGWNLRGDFPSSSYVPPKQEEDKEDEDDEDEEAESLEPERISQNDYASEPDRLPREEREQDRQQQRRGQEEWDDTPPPRRDRR